MGNAKVSHHDNRELILIVQSDSWIYSRDFKPDLFTELNVFAKQIELVGGKSLSTTSAPARGELADHSSLAQVKQLHELMIAGAITEEEFTTHKARLLERMHGPGVL